VVNPNNSATYIGKGAQVNNTAEGSEKYQERVQKVPKDGYLSLTELSGQLLTFPSQQARNGKRGR
jgi:predicted component of type VI protein secretion system